MVVRLAVYMRGVLVAALSGSMLSFGPGQVTTKETKGAVVVAVVVQVSAAVCCWLLLSSVGLAPQQTSAITVAASAARFRVYALTSCSLGNECAAAVVRPHCRQD
jgi:hypothetical protein